MIPRMRGVIVEGSDCSGKTTLVKRLKASLSEGGWDVLDMGHKPGDQFKRYMSTYLNADGLLLDRGHFSEIVYGDLWREGSHFAAWERSLLDDIAREEFTTVLCTAPPEILRNRYAERNYLQVAGSNELEILQEKFIETLAPHRPVMYESITPASLDRAVEEILRHLQPEGEGEHKVLKSAWSRNSDLPEFVLLEGANGSGKSTVAKLLKVNLVGWHVKTLDYDPLRPPFHRFMADYIGGDRAIFDRGHFSEVVYGDMFRDGRHFTSREFQYLCEYVAGRGLIVLCEALPETLQSRVSNAIHPKHIHPERLDEVSERFRRVLDQSGVPYCTVKTDNSESVGEIISAVTRRLNGVRYSVMGWDCQNPSRGL
jgi:hypothetical protein